MLCDVMGVSRSGYYDFLNRPPSKRAKEDKKLSAQIIDIHQKSYGTYGKRRLQKKIAQYGQSIGLQRIARLMKGLNIKAKAAKRFRVTTDSNHSEKISPNKLNTGVSH